MQRKFVNVKSLIIIIVKSQISVNMKLTTGPAKQDCHIISTGCYPKSGSGNLHNPYANMISTRDFWKPEGATEECFILMAKSASGQSSE